MTAVWLSFLLLFIPLSFGCYVGDFTASSITKGYITSLPLKEFNSPDCGITFENPTSSNFKIIFGEAPRGLKYKNMCVTRKGTVVCSCNDPYEMKCNTIDWFLVTITQNLMEDKGYHNVYETLAKKWFPKRKHNHVEIRRAHQKKKQDRKRKDEEDEHLAQLHHLMPSGVIEGHLMNNEWYRSVIFILIAILYISAFFLTCVSFGVPRRIRRYIKKKKAQRTAKEHKSFETKPSAEEPGPTMEEKPTTEEKPERSN